MCPRPRCPKRRSLDHASLMEDVSLGRRIPDRHWTAYRGQILGRNPDKSLKSFLPSYSQSPLQLCLEIFISSNSRNFLHISTVQLLYTVKEKGGKPDRKPFLPLWFKKFIQKPQVWELSRIWPCRNLNETVSSWIRLQAVWYSQQPLSVTGTQASLT